jgi:hypothetical protein
VAEKVLARRLPRYSDNNSQNYAVGKRDRVVAGIMQDGLEKTQAAKEYSPR